MVATWLDICLAGLAVYLVNQLLSKKPLGPLPPGPRAWPLLGNLLDMPTTREWETFAELGRKYGGMAYVTVFGQKMMLVSDSKLVIDMLDKKSAKYSARPTMPMAGELMGWRDTLIFQQPSHRFREYRRYFHQLLGSKKNMAKFLPVEEYETALFLQKVMAAPADLSQHVRRTAGAIILRIAYGYELQEGADPLVDLVDKAMLQFSAAVTPGAFLVDVLPFLRHVPSWFPGAGFKRTAKEWRDCLTEVVEKPFAFTKQQMAAGTAPPSFVSDVLQDEASLSEEDLKNIKWTAASMYTGGSDTTVSAIYSFFLAMTLYPEVQKKAQAEIDAVVGPDRLPNFSDRSQMPYIEALLTEVQRWNVVAPLALPHRLEEDDWQNGYFIPAGSLIVPNIWWMVRDPENYPNPSQFDPERYIAAPGKKVQLDPRTFSFGFGRRTCPGINLADASLFISIAMSLAVFDITKVVENGVEITPVVECTTGSVCHPKPFQCDIKPRSAKAAALIQQEPIL